VKYVVLIYSNPATWESLPQAERDRVLGLHDRILGEMRERGELIRVDGLTDPTTTRTIRARDGVPVVTDGPFGEAKEQLAGVWAIDVDSLERAIELASPITDYDVVEIRGLMDLSGYEM
jgi:hypothetical protein